MMDQLKQLSKYPPPKKVLRWNGIKSFTDYPDVCANILDTIFQEPDWVVHVPLEGNIPEVLKRLKSEQCARIHLGITGRLSKEGTWETAYSQQEVSQKLGFKTYLILEYDRPDTDHVKSAVAFSKTLGELHGLQINIDPCPEGGEEPGTYEDVARKILEAFRNAAEGTNLAPIRVKHRTTAENRTYWQMQFMATVDNPFTAFAEFFGKSNEEEWSPELKNDLVDLLRQVRNTQEEKQIRPLLLHKIRLLAPERATIEKDPSFAKACQAVLGIGQSEAYRSFQTGGFLHLLEEKKVPRDKWPTHPSHLRNLLASKMTNEQKVSCWLKIVNQPRVKHLTAPKVNKEVNVFLEEHKLPIIPDTKDAKKQFIGSLESISKKAAKEFSGCPGFQTFANACKAFSERLANYTSPKGQEDTDTSAKSKNRKKALSDKGASSAVSAPTTAAAEPKEDNAQATPAAAVEKKPVEAPREKTKTDKTAVPVTPSKNEQSTGAKGATSVADASPEQDQTGSLEDLDHVGSTELF